MKEHTQSFTSAKRQSQDMSRQMIINKLKRQSNGALNVLQCAKIVEHIV